MPGNHSSPPGGSPPSDAVGPGRVPDQASDQITEALRSMAAASPVSLRVTGQCMEPIIRDETEIVVSAQRRYWPGDILAFHSAVGDLRVHRLVGFLPNREGLLLQMRADAAGTVDQPIARDQVIGKVIGTPKPHTVPFARRLSAVTSFLRIVIRRLLAR